MSGFLAILRTQIGRTTRAHGNQLALVTNAELSLLKPRDSKGCDWKRVLSLTRAVMETLMSVSLILCAKSTPLGQSSTFFWSRRSSICELSVWQPCGARLKNYPSFQLVTGLYFANYPFRSSLPLFPKEGTLEANITTFSLANISIHSYHSEYVVWSQRQSDLPARNFLRDCPLHCSFLQLSFGVWLKLPFSLVFTLGYFTRKLLF